MREFTLGLLPAIATDIEIRGQRFAHLLARKIRVGRHGVEVYEVQVVDEDTGMLQPSAIKDDVIRSLREHPEQWTRVSEFRKRRSSRPTNSQEAK
jgi:hypothetical protein